MKNSALHMDSFFKPSSDTFNLKLIFAATFIAFVGAPLFFLTPEQTIQSFGYLNSIYSIILVSLYIIFFLCSFYALYKLAIIFKKPLLGSYFVGFIFSWIVFSAFLLPLTSDGGMFEAIDGKTNWRNLILLANICVVTAGVLISKHAKIALVFFTIFIGVTLAQKTPKLMNEFNTEISADPILLSKETNIIVIGLDGIPGQIALDVLEENPRLQDQFKDFTHFKNATATSPSTEASLMGLVLGNRDFTKIDTLANQELKTAYFNNANAYNFYTNESFYHFNVTGTKVAVSPVIVGFKISNLIEIYQRTMLRLFTNVGAKAVEKVSRILFSPTKEEWKNSTIIIDEMSTRFQSGSDKPSIVYMHFDFTHHPVTLDENCEYRSADPTWKAANQNEKGIKNLTICGLKKLSDLIDHLKGVGAYDNSHIIFYSDHGKPAGYFSASPDNLRINNNPHWGYNRYRPMLMIKEASVRQDGPVFDTRPILLDDLSKTMCRRLESVENCVPFEGVDLLDPKSQPPEAFYIHIVEDENSTWERQTHIAVNLPRNVALLDAMRENQSIKLSEHSTAKTPLTQGLE